MTAEERITALETQMTEVVRLFTEQANAKPQQKEFYTTTEAAALTGLAKCTVWKYCFKGKIQSTRPGAGRNYLISAAALKNFTNAKN